ncbi:enolase C-terminal domain-like protein [Aureibaculum sp. 2210JD6-5]|uniref:enolase C-terminal domain-like protein n=1 Tax=Aureibaculum sp. 2210JD6-5 TaxID=3103957 RepID=UPI002AACD1EA|nr:enolase C-terminal domain-like protein [Aureibaculum sp. 2210JD6-5]MDY7396965.1 enolase C-terminal domain-like protein [Aureibaculum sp. 2210JD6-5]
MNETTIIKKATASDKQFQLNNGAGSDAIHTTPIYAYAVCRLETDTNIEGIGLAFTLGKGNNLVCQAIEHLTKHVEGKEINELMANFGATYKVMAEDPNFRWLGPHKGVVHLALASVVNACFDLWAKSKDVPLWKLLIDLPAEAIVKTLDLSYLEEVMTREEALSILTENARTKHERTGVLDTGYLGYDTSIGWFNYSDEKVKANIGKAMDAGFTAMKLKVGSDDIKRDIRRAKLVRETAGDKATIMLDANQQWNLPKAIEICNELKEINPYWVEEPTHPDDVLAHVTLAKEIAPIKLALGEHVPNKIIFKNFLQSGCMSFNQVDAVRVGGISEFITISLMSKKFGVPVVPHVGDMGQIHQHMVLFNHIAMGHEALFLEHIPHLKQYFKNPAQVVDGFYQIPQHPGMSTDFND